MSKREKGALPFLYETTLGRGILKLLTARWLSKAAGAFCDSRLSKPLIRGFVEKNGIDLSQFADTDFSCFNACFTRKIRPELRPIAPGEETLLSPSDGLLSAYSIADGTVFPAKQSAYSVASLLRDEALAEEFAGGTVVVVRLCVEHYHRYCYVAGGTKGENIFLPGKLHTVRPIALRNRPVFVENCREYTVLETEAFGKVIQCEIGALLVGRIQNHHGPGPVERGGEKGMFLYGGSTVVLLLQKDRVALPAEWFENTAKGLETPVRYGSALGTAIAAERGVPV